MPFPFEARPSATRCGTTCCVHAAGLGIVRRCPHKATTSSSCAGGAGGDFSTGQLLRTIDKSQKRRPRRMDLGRLRNDHRLSPAVLELYPYGDAHTERRGIHGKVSSLGLAGDPDERDTPRGHEESLAVALEADRTTTRATIHGAGIDGQATEAQNSKIVWANKRAQNQEGDCGEVL